ncbi:MAG: ATP-dependent DNA helicase PcrA [Chloroflexota bacterium]
MSQPVYQVRQRRVESQSQSPVRRRCRDTRTIRARHRRDARLPAACSATTHAPPLIDTEVNQHEHRTSPYHALLQGLNAEQQQAVTLIHGPVLVVAGPGSGKTRVLTHRIAYLVEACGVAPERILAVTFTNKAAREMRERIDRLIGKGASEGLVMGTFHSFGARLLRQNPGLVADRLGVLPNFLIYDDADQLAIVKQAILAVGLDPKQVAPRRMLSRISAAKSQLLTPAEFEAQVETYDDEVVARVYREYQRSLRRANAVDFDDLLGLPIRLFDEAPALLERYQEQFLHILVDEYQDTNRVQYVLVAALAAKHRNLFVVGDPDQSIYGWRQADIRNILDFEREFPDAKRIHLELNYRSTRRIVTAADRVIRENTQRIDRRLRTDNEDGEPIVIKELADQNHEATFILSEIRRLMHRNGLSPDDFAVMYRTTAQSRVIEAAFRNGDIPYRIVGGVRFYDRKEVRDILAVLRLLYNPADEVSLERIIEQFPIGRGLGPKTLDSLRTWTTLNRVPLLDAFLATAGASGTVPPPDLPSSARAPVARFGVVFASLRSDMDRVTLTELFDRIVERTGYEATFDHQDEESMQRWANVLELRAALGEYDHLPPADALATYLEQVALISDVDELNDQERGKVTLITLHSAKGLEFPVVFIAGVEEGLLPISRAVEGEFSDPMPLEEERRLFYVGITRAQKLLYITYAATRVAYGRFQSSLPSRFLLSLPQESTRDHGARAMRTRTATGFVERVRVSDTGRLSPSSDPDAGRDSGTTLGRRAHTSFRPKQRVFHPKFGEGVIAEVKKTASDQELTVEFIRHGRKLLLASLAPLDVIADPS